MSTASARSRNLSVETFRLLGMFFVIVPHLVYPNLPSEWVSAARLLTRWILPFFYIVSGYYFAEKCSRTGQVDAAPVIDRLAWLFIVWNLINIPVFLAEAQLSAADFLKLIVSPSFIFLGYSSHLWFVSSLLFGYLFIAFCYRNRAEWLLALVSAVSLLLVLYAGSYYVVFNPDLHIVFSMPRHWLAVPFLYLGGLFFRKGYPGWQASLLLVIFGIALQFIEAEWLRQYGLSAYTHQFLVGAIPFGIGMAGLALGDLQYLRHPTLGRWGSEYSLGIYVIHPMIGYMLAALVTKFVPALHANPIWQATLPLALFLLSLLLLIALKHYLPAVFNFLLGKRAARNEAATA